MVPVGFRARHPHPRRLGSRLSGVGSSVLPRDRTSIAGTADENAYPLTRRFHLLGAR
jgi:hypothetical protein